MSIFEEYGAFSDTLNPKHSTCHLGKNIFSMVFLLTSKPYTSEESYSNI